ncbi:MAG TPA: HEPN domain-containing protein [Vicinamibacteria bacterium]|nr:HEPN domain-containing protein [Vicinamibacteria bacterium]
MRRARSNLARALMPPSSIDVLYDDLCFDAQQAAEKALKALLVWKQIDFPKTHSIGELLDLVRDTGVVPPVEITEAQGLTRHAVTGRYPRFSEDVSPEEWRQAAELAERVVRWAESVISGGVAPGK